MLASLKALEERLREEWPESPMAPAARAALFAAFDEGPHAIGLFDPDDNLAYGNAVFREAWRIAPGPTTFDSMIRDCYENRRGTVVATDDIDDWLVGARKNRREGPPQRAFAVDFWDGRWFWLTERRLDSGWVLFIGQDITALKQSERTLQVARDAALTASLTDALTQLPNRRSAVETIEERLRSGRPLCLALVDLGQFKQINDSYGHATGDGLLIEFGRRLSVAAGLAGCMAARLAGDEFAVVSPPGMTVEEFRGVLDGVASEQRATYDLNGVKLNVGVSVGVARAPVDGANVGELLAAADTAMYCAKQAGRYALRVFDPEMGARRRDQAELRRDLPQAFARGEFQPYYQPVVELRSGRIIKFELLARWLHPQLGVLTPDRFLPLLTSAEQLTQLTAQLLLRAGTDIAGWPEGVRLAFNVSPYQLTRESILPMLEDLRSSGAVPLGRLEMEITESALVHNPVEAREVVDAVRRMGLSTALDDFGVGFSGLQHLRDIPFDRVKLDRSFVRDIAHDDRSRLFVGAIVDLARKLGLSVIAEGIEDAETGSALAEIGCHYGQGYFFGRPIAAANAQRLLDGGGAR